jgi:type IV pilus assembly protein PilV
MKAMRRFSNRSRSRGFTLIEALVSLLVLSIGLLGVAALQLTSLRANTSASTRSQATFLAYDITDRMRANRNVATNTTAYNIDFGEDTAASPATVAENDLKDWLVRLKNALGPDAQAQVQNLGNSMVAVRLRWNDSHGDTLNSANSAMTATPDITFEIRARI